MTNLLLVLSIFILSSCAQLEKFSPQKLGIKAPARNINNIRPIWIKNLDPKYESGNLPIGSASPLIFEDMLFVGSLSGDMNAYDLETGRLKWSESHKHTFNSKPIIFKNYLIYGSMQGRIFARDYITGKLVYSADVGASVESDPTLIRGRLFFHLRDHRILAMDAMTGKIFWSYKRSVPYLTTLQRVSHALSYGNKLIVGFADGYVCALSIEEGILEWEQKITTAIKFVDVDVRPVYFNGMIVIGSASGDIKFIDPRNGAVAKSFNFNLSYEPLKVKNSLLFGTTRGDLVLMDSNGKVFKKARISKSAISSIKKWKSGLAVTTMDGMFHYLDMNFNIINTFNLGHEQSSVFGYLESNEDVIALYSSRNRLYVFK